MTPPPIPPSPVTRRSLRYLGDNLASSLQDLAPADAAAIRDTYALLREMMGVLKNSLEQQQPLHLLLYARERRLDEVLETLAQRLRAIPLPENTADEAALRLRKNLHDVRGGAFASLVVSIELILMLNTEISVSDALRTFYLVRDQLKILRNCFTDLDHGRCQMDRALNLHSSDLIVQKWDGLQRLGKTVRCHATATVNIACCCLEFSTVDRVIYNLMNNALTYGEGETVDLWVQADQSQPAANMLLTVENTVSHATKEVLLGRFGTQLNRMFLGGFSTSGGGDGLRICADCVRNAYGYTSSQEALEDGLFGAQLLDENEKNLPLLRMWFFWPVMADA